MTSPHRYSDAERAAIYRVIAERRDMRHFINAPVAAETFEMLFENTYSGATA